MKGKTTLKRKTDKNAIGPAAEEKDITRSKIIKGKTRLGKGKLKPKQQENNISQNLVEQIILTYFTARWQNKSTLIRASARPNPKDKNVRSLVRVLDRAINYHTFLYLMELFDIMSEMPMPSRVEHDPNYGKVFLVKNDNIPKNEVENVVEDEVKNVIKEDNNLRVKIENDNNEPIKFKDNYVKFEGNYLEKYNYKYDNKMDEFDEELAKYMYRNDGNAIDRYEVEQNINRLIEEYPEKDIDVERILNSKRLQYKLKHPRYSPFTNKDNIDCFTRYLYTYIPDKNRVQNENLIVLKNKTYAYY